MVVARLEPQAAVNPKPFPQTVLTDRYTFGTTHEAEQLQARTEGRVAVMGGK